MKCTKVLMLSVYSLSFDQCIYLCNLNSYQDTENYYLPQKSPSCSVLVIIQMSPVWSPGIGPGVVDFFNAGWAPSVQKHTDNKCKFLRIQLFKISPSKKFLAYLFAHPASAGQWWKSLWFWDPKLLLGFLTLAILPATSSGHITFSDTLSDSLPTSLLDGCSCP
jgi:hypothetical protein